VVRRYGLVSASAGGVRQPARHRGATARHGLSKRHWQLLSLVATYGVLDTRQVTALMFDSRPTAARHLAMLVKAGLLVRSVKIRDPAHLAHYKVSGAGAELLARRLHEAGEPVPLGFGTRRHRDEAAVNDFVARLVAHARRTGQGHLYRWRHALDAAAWLRSHGIAQLDTSGYGMWIEGNLAVGFLLHIDDYPPAMALATPPASLLSGYQQARSRVPVAAALVITASDERERWLHRDTLGLRLPIRVAATTIARLHTAASPADMIWSVAGVDDLMRLVDLGRAAPPAP